ncbi:AAA family ATPase [Candidatus Dojkabacteria bacterium]|nr:AAA family ATPase [Candidatus Dojkabacteria bacterium]
MASLPKTNLPPPDYTEFIGREDELSLVKRELSAQGRNNNIAIDGLGGIGKTALILEICSWFQQQYMQLPKEERFDYIIWTSAKVEDMTPSGLTPRTLMQNTLSSIYSTIAEVLKIPNRLSLQEDKLTDAVYKHLKKNRSLIVIDSFEQLENPAAIIELLDEIPLPTKVLITTRPNQQIQAVKAIRLEGLSNEDSLKLVSQMSNASELNLEQRKEIARYSSGVPLVIYWALGRIGLGDAYSSVVKKLEVGVPDLSQYCISDSIELIKTTKAEEIALSLLPLVSPVKVQAVGEVVDLSLDVKIRDDETQRLIGLQLVHKSRNNKLSLSTMARSALLSAYTEEKKEEITRKWANYYLQLLTEILDKHGRVDSYSDIFQEALLEIENITAILGNLAEFDPRLYCVLLEASRYMLYMRGNWIERDRLLVKGYELAQKHELWCQILLFASDLGWVSTYQLHYDRSSRFFKSAESALNKCDEHYYKAKYYMDFARYCELSAVHADDYGDSEKNYFLALDEAKKADSSGIHSTCLYYLGVLYYRIGNKAQAKAQFEEGLKIALSHNASREADRHQSMIALIFAESGQYADSKKLFERIIADAEVNNDKVRQADFILAMATAENISGNRRGAVALLTQAEELYSELGRHQEVEGIRKKRREEGLN